MSESNLVSPLLDDFALGAPMNSHAGVSCCPAMKENSDNKYIVKIVSLPASQVQLDALLLTGAYKDPAAALDYFRQQADEMAAEAEFLQQMSKLEGFLPFEGWQVTPMKKNRLGYHVYLVSSYRRTLEKHMTREPMTHLEAVNLGLDMCDALAVCRRAGYIYVDLKPSNIYISEDKEYRIGDLGFVAMDFLKYTSMPDRYISAYTAPEVKDTLNTLNETVDTYALGMILYRIFNNGAIPALPQDPATPLDPPAMANAEMADIILKACAPKPEDRWQSPEDMGKAIAAYMQRNTINDTPIMDMPAPQAAEPADEEVSESVQPEAAPAADPVAEDDNEKTKRFDPAMLAAAAENAQAPAQEASQETAPAQPEAADTDAPSAKTEIAEAAPTPEAPVQEAPVQEAAPAEVPIQPAEEPAPAPAPVHRPAPVPTAPRAQAKPLYSIDPTQPRPASARPQRPSQEKPAQPAAVSTPAAAPQIAKPGTAVAEKPKPTAKRPPVPKPVADSFDLDNELKEVEALLYGDAPIPATPKARETVPSSAVAVQASTQQRSNPVPPAKPKHRILTTILVTLLVLAMLVGIGFGGYRFYQNYYLQSVESISIEGTESTMTVTLVTDIDDDLLDVSCMDIYGNSVRQPVKNKQAVFQNLSPDALYKVTVEISGLHKLVGQISDVYTTEAQTEIVSFTAVTGQEDGSVLLSITAHGHEPDEWIVTCTAEGEDEVVHKFSGHSTTVKGLTIAKEYLFRLTTSDGTKLKGEDGMVFTPASVIPAENLSVVSRKDGEMIVHWDTPAGAKVPKWSVRCYSDDYDETVETAETTVSFRKTEDSKAYTIEVLAQGMTQPTRLSITANPVNIKSIKVDDSQDGPLNVTWSYDGKAPESGWLLIYTIDGSADSNVLKCPEASATIEMRIPESTYAFEVQAADSTSVFNSTSTYKCPAAKQFSSHGISSYKMNTKLLPTPAEPNWLADNISSETFTTSFKVGDKVSAVVTAEANFYLDPTEDVKIMYLFRDVEGHALSNLVSYQDADWKEMFFDGDYHKAELDLPKLPSQAGTYQLDLYFNGMFVSSTSFSLN